MTRNPKIC